MHFKLESNYAVLSPDGTGKWTPGGDAFWSQPPEEIDKVGRDWLVTEHVFTSSWDYQEIHPEADEFCYVLDGEVTMHLETRAGSDKRSVALKSGCAFLIPRETWHWAGVLAPVRMIFVTMGAGTTVRPHADGHPA